MTAQPGRPQAPFTAGELAPTLRERRDLKYYRAGALYMRNVEVIPQGGFRQAPGSRQLAHVRRDLAAISIAAATLTAPNGGTAANIRDGSTAVVLTTSSLSGAGPHVLATVTFAAATAVAAVDVREFIAAAATGSIAVQYFAGAVWVNLDGTKGLRKSARTRRFAAPPRAPVTATQWRVVAADLTAAGTITLAEVAFWAEGASFGAVRVRPFMDKDGNETKHAVQDGHVDVVNDAWIATYAVPHAAAQLRALKTIQQLDTLVAFHPDVAPHRVLRQGADTEWQSAPAPIVNVPNYDYGGTYVNGVPAIWEVRIIVGGDSIATNSHFIITVNGDDTLALTPPLGGGSAADWSSFAPLMQAAIEALPGVEPGVAVAFVGDSSDIKFTITFSGAGNEGDGWLLSMRAIDAEDIACPAYRKQKGIAPGEPIISGTQGWPRCGVFFQQALLMGGLKALPNTWMKSWAGDYWNFETDTSNPTGGMLVPMDTQGGEAIEEMVAGRSLMIMTSLAEYFLAERAIAKTAAPNHVETSRHGITSGVPAVENEGSAIFVQKSGGVIYEFRYDDVGQTFNTQNMTILASHLIDDVRDQAIRRATKDNDANNLHLILANGEARIFALLREQDVTAGTRRETDGKFLAACALNGTNTIDVVTERQVAGAAARFVETLDPDCLLDQAQTFTFEDPTSHITGLDDFEGATVWAIADDDVLGPFIVTAGVIDLPEAALDVTIGRWTAPRVETLPVDRSIGPGTVLERRGRIHTVRLSLIDTTSIAIGANGGKIYDVPLLRFGDAMGVPALQKKFTGVIKVQGLTGFADQPTVVITQKRPGLLNLRGITIEGPL